MEATALNVTGGLWVSVPMRCWWVPHPSMQSLSLKRMPRSSIFRYTNNVFSVFLTRWWWWDVQIFSVWSIWSCVVLIRHLNHLFFSGLFWFSLFWPWDLRKGSFLNRWAHLWEGRPSWQEGLQWLQGPCLFRWTGLGFPAWTPCPVSAWSVQSNRHFQLWHYGWLPQWNGTWLAAPSSNSQILHNRIRKEKIIAVSAGNTIRRDRPGSHRSTLSFCWILLYCHKVIWNTHFIFFMHIMVSVFICPFLSLCWTLVRQAQLTAVKTSWCRLTIQNKESGGVSTHQLHWSVFTIQTRCKCSVSGLLSLLSHPWFGFRAKLCGGLQTRYQKTCPHCWSSPSLRTKVRLDLLTPPQRKMQRYHNKYHNWTKTCRGMDIRRSNSHHFAKKFKRHAFSSPPAGYKKQKGGVVSWRKKWSY